MAVLSVNEKNFQQEVLESELPVLIDLWAAWCQPCKEVSPRVEDVARELEGRLKVVKLDVEANPRLAKAFEARSIPMLVVVAEGRPGKSAVGALSKKESLALVEPFLPRGEHEVTVRELVALQRERRVVVLDVREAPVYGRAHIPGARSAPVETLETLVATFARERRVPVVYDRSGGEEAKRALEVLTKHGLPAMFLQGGFLAWESEGLEVERPS